MRLRSSESGWVSQHSNEDEEGREEEDDGEEHRLIRTSPVIDLLDVEVLEVTGAQKDELDEEFNLYKSVNLALQTLGVVFGDVGTSPLYTFDVMFNKSPIRRKEDVLGALSLVLYTLILIPLIKYVLVVLWGNDDGEGTLEASLLPNQLPSDARISSFRLKVPSPELERSLKIKELLEASPRLKKLLLMLVLFGSSMLIADGVVTPAMSVLSAVGGLEVGISGVEQGIAELGVMMVTTILVTIIMLLIWQTNIISVMCFVIIFLGVELVFISSVLGGVGDGSWVLLVFAAIVFMAMNIWNYGIKLKYDTEVRQKLPMDLLLKLGCNLGTVRAPGIGLVYNELVKGVPAIFGHFLTSLPAIHSMIVFVCIKYVPVPVVPQNERFLFRRVCPRSYHMFRCISRYGYKDVRKENHQTFEQLLIRSLENFIRREAQELSLASYDDADSDAENEESQTRILIAANGSMYSLSTPLLADDRNGIQMPTSEASTSSQPAEENSHSAAAAAAAAEKSPEKELALLHKAKETGVVYLLGHGDIRARKDSWFFKKLIINYFYAFLRKNSRRSTADLSIPHSNLMQVSMTCMVWGFFYRKAEDEKMSLH